MDGRILMSDLRTTYLGLDLSCPLIVGSSGLTRDVHDVKACADAGAGAVVLKSIFEEQIREDFADFDHSMEDATYHPEAYEYFRADLASRFGAHDYCTMIEKARGAVEIPVIASVNCFSNAAWSGYAREVEAAGASALELNVSFPPLTQLYAGPGDHMNAIADVVNEICTAAKIPVAVKLPPAGVYVGLLASKLAEAGAKGLVLFNRFFVPTVDVARQELRQDIEYSVPGENAMPRRYLALLSKRVACDFSASTGIHTADDALAMLLVGARAVQVVSAVYRGGFAVIGAMRDGMEAWMKTTGHASIDAFRGSLASAPDDLSSPFGRYQYIRTLTEGVPDSPGR